VLKTKPELRAPRCQTSIHDSLIVQRRVAIGGPSLLPSYISIAKSQSLSATRVTCGLCDPFSAWSLSLTERRHG
jgi:hypothetical protein